MKTPRRSLALFFFFVAIALTGAATAATITVNSNADTTTAGDGQCTLREAITNSNGNSDTTGGDCTAGSGTDTIQFNLGSGTPTITVSSGLPSLNEAVTIDGNTGTATRVEINGNGVSANGLFLDGNGNTIKSLVINRFAGDGITLNTSNSNTIQGNYIGTNAAGTTTAGFGNSGSGIRVLASQSNTIGGTTGTTPGGSCTGVCNLISGNSSHGINLDGSGPGGASSNIIQGNFIGTDVTGTLARGNGQSGLNTFNPATSNQIGGTAAGAGNVISGNGNAGIFFGFSSKAGTVIQGNLIGTNSAGTAKIPNSDGIEFFADTTGVTIGGTSPGASNVISGNRTAGITKAASNFGTVHGVIIQGNFIGTDVTGTINLGNGADDPSALNARGGISLTDGANGNTIGGIAAGEANTIAFNTGAGVRLGASNGGGNPQAGSGNVIRGNRIYLNNGLGISFTAGGGIKGSPLANDDDDPDGGANNGQNYPILDFINDFGGTFIVVGTFNSLPSTNFTIDFYASENPDGSGYGEGQTYVGSQSVMTDANGNTNISFNYTPTAGLPFITATATNPATNDTSEFSNAVLLEQNPGTFVFSSATYSVVENAGLATITVNRANGSRGAACVSYATSDGTANSSDYTPASGQFCFADQETSKTFNITIATDTVPEPHETINLTLSSPTGGAALGFQYTAILTIINDDSFVTYVVNNAADTDDGACTAVGTDNGCTLREAITAANTTPDQDSITFDIGSTPTINVTSALPSINAPVIIDGNTGGAARVELNGAGAGSASGLSLTSDGGRSLIRRLVINRFAGAGISLSNSSNNIIEANYIGTDAGGTIDLGNGAGITFTSANDNLIGGAMGTTPGGSCTGSCNLISGNGNGISADPLGGSANRNVIQGNFIGTDVTGTVAIPNARAVGFLNAVNHTLIGGDTPNARNLISGNSEIGVIFSAAGTHDNVVQGNYIGVNTTATAKLGNSVGVVLFFTATQNRILGNVIGGNVKRGIELSTFGDPPNSPPHDNQVRENFIGTDPSGTIDLGNGQPGITVEAVGGIVLVQGAYNTEIWNNVIAFNYGAGVRLGANNSYDAAGTGNGMNANSIYSNNGLGIALGDGTGVLNTPLPNDTGDADTGPNNRQNYPVLTGATSDGSTVTVTGSLNSTPDTGFAIELFVSNSADASANGEGQTRVQSEVVLTDANGNATFSIEYPPVIGKQLITATARNFDNDDTSEFSARVTDPTIQSSAPAVTADDAAGTVNDPITVTAAFTDADGSPPYTASIDCGNGNMASDVQVTPAGVGHPGTVSGVCTYAAIGAYTATVTVVDAFGVPGSDTANVAVNGVPVANDGSLTTDEDTAANGNLSATDDNSSLTYSVVSGPTKGAITAFDPSTGAFTYAPNFNVNGTDSFTFKVNDGQLDSNTATVSITINAVNDPPIAGDGSFSTDEDTATDGTLGGGDFDSTFTFELVSDPTKGVISNFNSTTGRFTYTPNANETGSDSFTFRLNDGQATSNIATISITINPLNDAPVANAQSMTMNEDGSQAITLSASDTEGTAMSFSVVTLPTHGDLTGTPPNLTYTPHANYNGSDSFTFQANDGQADSNVATVSITMDAVSDAPTADAQSVTTDEDMAKSIMLTGGDVDGDMITFTVVSQPTHGDLTGTGPNLTYTPAANYNGSDSFTFKANDGTTDSNVATVSITVNAVNDPPVTNDADLPTNEDIVAFGTLPGGDVDSTVTFEIVTNPTKGVISDFNSATGRFTYTPNANQNGTDSFDFRLSDGTDNSDTKTITITITPVNDAPSFVKGPDQTLNQGAGPQSVPNWASNISPGAADESGQGLTFMVSNNNSTLFSSQPAVSSDGTLTFTPAANADGSATVTVSLMDNGGAANGGQDTSPAQTFTITLTAPSPTPTPTPTPSATPSASPTPSATPSASPTPSATPKGGPSPTPSATPSASPTPSATPSASPTPTASATPTPSATPSSTPAQALNISTRLRVDTGDKVMIGGFIISGNVNKAVLLRGMGPSLVSSGIPAASVLNDPVLELRGPDGALITTNDNWKDSPQRAQIEGGLFEPGDDREAVILATLPPGAYTAILEGVDQTSGVGLVEIYDNDPSADSELANISTRGFVETGTEVMIGGFMLGGNNNPTSIVVRALGPSLAGFGLSNLLADPTLELHNADGTIMIANDNWQDDPASAAQLVAVGLAPSDQNESGIFASLAPPGQFTAVVAGKDGGIGIALIEIYNLK